ncbi:MAG: hypothetical protein RLZZ624_857 [Cyanobacteriota bacterium]|jgi:serine/threonine-protein kinase
MATSAAPGQVLAERYRLEMRLADGSQGSLWRGVDLLADQAPVALRQLVPGRRSQQLQALAGRLQALLHPQVPRFGGLIEVGADRWLVRDWQGGRTYADLLSARAERQLVFSGGEVLLLLRQLLPVLVVLHHQDLLHGDLTPSNLLRRDRDGLPVLLDFGLVQDLSPGAQSAALPLEGLTPGYAPPEALAGEPPAPWMDLHALGVTALVLLSGDRPEALLDPVTMEWRWPADLDPGDGFGALLARLLSRDPEQRFASAAAALSAAQALPLPEAPGPVPRADRTLLLIPPPPEAGGPAPAAADDPAPSAPLVLPELRPAPTVRPVLPARRRRQAQEEAAEAGLAPVLIALAGSLLVGTTLGGWWLSRGTPPPAPTAVQVGDGGTLPAVEIDQRQQLLSRLRALQIDRGWFLRLVDGSLLAQYPERQGRLPGDSAADAPLRRLWNELAEEWLARVEPLPLPIRQRLGSLSMADWSSRQSRLAAQGLSEAVLRQLVSASARNLLPGRPDQDLPPEPLRQLWLAAAMTSLDGLQLTMVTAPPRQARELSADVPAGGARLFAIRIPPGHSLVLGVNGSPLMQMSVFASDGRVLEARGPLRVARLTRLSSPQVQLLVANEGVAAAPITVAMRADPPPLTPPGGSGAASAPGAAAGTTLEPGAADALPTP